MKNIFSSIQSKNVSWEKYSLHSIFVVSCISGSVLYICISRYIYIYRRQCHHHILNRGMDKKDGACLPHSPHLARGNSAQFDNGEKKNFTYNSTQNPAVKPMLLTNNRVARQTIVSIFTCGQLFFSFPRSFIYANTKMDIDYVRPYRVGHNICQEFIFLLLGRIP